MKRRGVYRHWLVVGFLVAGACDGGRGVSLPARESTPPDLAGLTLVARLAHISDTHVMDEESPARFAAAHDVTRSAWRSYESYSTQLLDGILRTVNRIHAAGRTINLLLHTGDACDNVQSNELDWLVGLLDGETINPLTGPDGRTPDERPPPELDPHAPFAAQGLYQSGVHGPQPSIPWYIVFGNHDARAIGVFPIFEQPDGHRLAPLPLDWRPGLVLPVVLDPLASFAHGNVTPADPGPPPLLDTPRAVEPNPARAYFNMPEYVRALHETKTGPAGHGLPDPNSGLTWYSVAPVAGLRLIGLDTTDAQVLWPGGLYSEGALSRAQLDFLRGELEAAAQRNELVIVASHHASSALSLFANTEVNGPELRDLLDSYPNVALHLVGHGHVNRVTQYGGYLEIETCSTLDPPQEGRLIEIWRDPAGSRVAVVYEMFSHLDDELPALGDDPLRALRAQAYALAAGDKSATARVHAEEGPAARPSDTPADRAGVVILRP